MDNHFIELNKINVNDKADKKNGLTYLSWAWAWGEFKKACPGATYEVVKFEGRPYFYDPDTGYMVYTTVTVDGLTHEMWLPVMDSANKAMKNHEYTYVDRYGKERSVPAATMFDINKTIMRCLTKNLAMFGLGLYIYAGEDLPDADEEAEADKKKTEATRKMVISEAKVKALKEKATTDGVNLMKLCEYANVSDLSKLTEDQFYKICNSWTKEVLVKCKEG